MQHLNAFDQLVRASLAALEGPSSSQSPKLGQLVQRSGRSITISLIYYITSRIGQENNSNTLETEVSQGAVNEINALKDQFGISPQAQIQIHC